MERELQALDAAGLPYERVQEDLERGILTLRVIVQVDGKPQDVFATFPDLYPYFRFQVRAPELDIPHHQNVFSKALCLIGRSTANWLIDDTLAEFLTDRHPRVVRVARASPSEASSFEEHQGEPLSNYFPYWPAMCLVDSEWKIPAELQCGQLVIGIIDVSMPVQGKPPALTAAVLEVLDDKGKIVCQAQPEITEAYGRRKMRGRWCRWTNVREGAAEDAREHARNVWKAVSNRDPRNSDQSSYREFDDAGNEAKFSVRGLLIEEEVGYQQTGLDGCSSSALPLDPQPQFGRSRRTGLQLRSTTTSHVQVELVNTICGPVLKNSHHFAISELPRWGSVALEG